MHYDYAVACLQATLAQMDADLAYCQLKLEQALGLPTPRPRPASLDIRRYRRTIQEIGSRRTQIGAQLYAVRQRTEVYVPGAEIPDPPKRRKSSNRVTNCLRFTTTET